MLERSLRIGQNSGYILCSSSAFWLVSALFYLPTGFDMGKVGSHG